jgi:putative membrane protein insertion efficiency factor
MKKILIKTIDFYQIFISSALHQLFGVKNACRHEVTCSQYAKSSILEKGVLVGSYLSFARLLKCQPFYKGK